VNLIWIGIDDTDSISGGCTTYVTYILIQKLIQKGYTIIGYPRLVRLNPNIPWKTRGNGAVSIQIGVGGQKKIPIGCINSTTLFASSQLVREYPDSICAELKILLSSIFKQYAHLQDPHTNPGFVIIKDKPSVVLYTHTVQDVVSISKIRKILGQHKACFKSYKNGRGLIGATAAIAWNDLNDKTYEVITYRMNDRWGIKRIIDTQSVIQMDTKIVSTFDNYDHINHHNRIAPSSPCPILFGIRGDKPEELFTAVSLIKSEPAQGMLLFVSNQGTDDHLIQKKIQDIRPYQSVIIDAKIRTQPVTKDGGHVFFSISDATGEIDCAAYEPTKQFRTIIRQLYPGDHIRVYGGVRQKPLTINLEKIYIRQLVDIIEKKENPICEKCGIHMKSIGTNQGFKCKKCGTKNNAPLKVKRTRGISLGWYEVAVCARRHLSKPIKRIIKN
jgi:tRNA(Ile2)-agmatinylcytidine synthase